MGVFRILLGFWNLANLVLILPSLDAWFSERGFVPLAIGARANPPVASDFYVFSHKFQLPFLVPRFDLINGIKSPQLFLAVYVALMVCALLTTIGLWTRVSSVLLAIGVVSLQHRNILILYGGDTVMRLGAIYIAMAPSGEACSVDRLIGLWKGRLDSGPAYVSAWPQRLMAFNVALIYFTTWWIKLDGEKWRNGLAVWYPERLKEFDKFPVPGVIKAAWMSPFLTFAALAVELALGTIVFWRPARKWVLVFGLILHAWIEYSMNVPLFAFAITSFYIAFYEGEEVTAWFQRLGQRLRRFALIVRTSASSNLDSGPCRAVLSLDALHLVRVEIGEGSQWTLEGRMASAFAVGLRMPGAWLPMLVPSLWPRMMKLAFSASSPSIE